MALNSSTLKRLRDGDVSVQSSGSSCPQPSKRDHTSSNDGCGASTPISDGKLDQSLYNNPALKTTLNNSTVNTLCDRLIMLAEAASSHSPLPQTSQQPVTTSSQLYSQSREETRLNSNDSEPRLNSSRAEAINHSIQPVRITIFTVPAESISQLLTLDSLISTHSETPPISGLTSLLNNNSHVLLEIVRLMGQENSNLRAD
jgi:hypothetical protein